MRWWQQTINQDLRCIFEVWFLSPSFFWCFFYSFVDVDRGRNSTPQWCRRCALWDLDPQAEALNDDVALSSLENEIQGACRKKPDGNADLLLFSVEGGSGCVFGMEFGKWNDEWCQRGDNFRFGFGKVADYVEVPMLNFELSIWGSCGSCVWVGT